MIKKYQELKHLFSCYFHQDMDLDYATPEEALKDYVFNENEGSGYVVAVLENIEKLKNDEGADLKILDQYIDRLGCEYYYQDDMTGLEWLDYLSTTIKKYLAEKESIEKSEKNGMQLATSWTWNRPNH